MFCRVHGNHKRGQEKSIVFDSVVAQSTSIHGDERTLACTLSIKLVRGQMGTTRVVMCLKNLKICFKDDLHGQWRNGNINQL
jgi:hypothetical protein